MTAPATKAGLAAELERTQARLAAAADLLAAIAEMAADGNAEPLRRLGRIQDAAGSDRGYGYSARGLRALLADDRDRAARGQS